MPPLTDAQRAIRTRANAVRVQAGWRCECTGTCGEDHGDRCPERQDRWSTRDELPGVAPHRQWPRDRARLFAVHRPDADCPDPRPIACASLGHYAAWCTDCRREIEDAAARLARLRHRRADRRARRVST